MSDNTKESLAITEDHKNILLIPDYAEKDTDDNYRTVNASLLQYSRKWNREFALMNKAGNEMVESANRLNAQTANFNNSLYSMYADLDGLIEYIKANPNWNLR